MEKTDSRIDMSNQLQNQKDQLPEPKNETQITKPHLPVKQYAPEESPTLHAPYTNRNLNTPLRSKLPSGI